jgi:hypothetical protein
MIYPDQLGNSVIYDIYTYCSYPTSIHISTYYLYIIVNYIYINCVYTCNRLLSTGMVYGIEFAPILRSGQLTVRELENDNFNS